MSLPSTPSALNADRLASSLAGILSGYEALFRPIEAAGFWAAVAMPFVYIPLLLAGVDNGSEQIALAALVALHVVALVVGKRYTPKR